MKIFNIIPATVFVLCIGFLSCSPGGPACGSFGFAFNVQNEILDLSAASTAYSQDPSPQNCQAYKNAYANYIDALKKYDKCVEASERDEWRQSLEEAERDVMDLQC